MPASIPPTRPEPIAVEEAVGELDDTALIALVADLWTLRGWSVIEERTEDARYVDLLLQTDWPHERRGLVRILRPSLARTLGGDDVQQFIGPVQRADVDLSHLVTIDAVSDTIRRHAAKFGVDVVDRSGLAARIERLVAYDLIARRVEQPVASNPELLISRAVTRISRAVNRHERIRDVGRWLGQRLPADPSPGDVAGFSFVGFKLIYVATAGLFGLVLAVETSGVAFWFLVAAFLVAVYGALLPVQALDIVLVRHVDDSDWRPSWWYLAAFFLVPVPLGSSVHYWYRRRQTAEASADVE